MAKIHFIIDPVDRKIGEQWPYEEEKIKALSQDYEVHIVRGRSHAHALARQAAKTGTDLLVCVGGDQAVSEVANALHLQSDSAPRLSIHGRLHTGDFGRSLPFRSNFLEFLDDYLQGKAIREDLDLGQIRYTGEYGQRIEQVFVNYAAFGYASVITNRRPPNASALRILRLIFATLPFYKIPALRCQPDGASAISEQLLTGFISLMPYAAGGLKIAPDANPRDGRFVLTKAKKSNILRYMAAALQSYFDRASQMSFIERVACKDLKIESTMVGRAVRIDFDGESRGYLPAEINIKEKALKILR